MNHNNNKASSAFNQYQIAAIFSMRLVMGWYLLYEGLIKIITPWTSKGYLITSDWILAGFFNFIAQSSQLLVITDIINIMLLTVIGFCLFWGDSSWHTLKREDGSALRKKL